MYVDEVRIRSKSGLRSSKEKKKTFQGLASGTNYKPKRDFKGILRQFSRFIKLQKSHPS